MYPKFYYLSCIFCALLLATSCQQKALVGESNDRFDVRNVRDSIHLGEYNEIAELKLNLTKDHFLKEVKLNVSSQDTLQSLRVYQMVESGTGLQKLPIAALNEVTGEIVVYLDKDLSAGEHTLVVSIYPKEKSVDQDVRVSFDHILSDKGRINNSADVGPGVYNIKRITIPLEMIQEDIEIEG
ncbi:hypothetical protein KIH41_10645 [Litoribacter ruber]|uniref:DUF4382 domain-containing protein n=1 Tax=Litoribacter ruber TaxID=702568 RepID=A0AAP2G5E9_9BACT|nr:MULTISPECIES: hypothetical protein [Litoribacter]MBS9525036.1 hypothetical protein [Litoribacter alkaliphilus]MBT0811733.1 hypothetical protein [Litoribacter ruber]